MKLNLPERPFFTPADLAIKWECAEGDVLHFIETGALPVADKHAARHGKRRTFFMAIEPEQPSHLLNTYNEYKKIGEEVLGPTEIPSEDDLVVTVRMSQQSFEDTGLWDDQLDRARQSFPDSRITVVLLQDVLEFEARHQAVTEKCHSNIEIPWIARARELGTQFKRENPRLSQMPLAGKVRKQLEVEGVVGRGGKIPDAATIKREALKGIK